jgi:hypothetical protein
MADLVVAGMALLLLVEPAELTAGMGQIQQLMAVLDKAPPQRFQFPARQPFIRVGAAAAQLLLLAALAALAAAVMVLVLLLALAHQALQT